MKFLPVLSLCLVALALTCNAQVEINGVQLLQEATVGQDAINVAWRVEMDEELNAPVLYMAATCPTLGYCAVSFAQDFGIMFPADVVAGYVTSDGSATVATSFAASRSPPQPDNQMLLDSGAMETDSNTTVWFKRVFDNGGMVPVTLGENNMNYAFGSDMEDFLTFHFSRRDSFMVELELEEDDDAMAPAPMGMGEVEMQ